MLLGMTRNSRGSSQSSARRECRWRVTGEEALKPYLHANSRYEKAELDEV
jgi:hypothetical protein